MAEENQTPQNQQPQPASKGQKKAVKVILIVLAVLVVLTVASVALIGWAGKTFFDRVADEAQIETTEDGVRIGDEDNGFEVREAELSDDFPEYVPLYEPSTVTGSSRFSVEDGTNWSVVLETEDSGTEVFNYYEEEFSGSGWNITSTMETGDSWTIGATYEEDSYISMSIHEIDDMTEFTLSVSHAEGVGN